MRRLTAYSLDLSSFNRALAPPRYAAGARRSCPGNRASDHLLSDAVHAALTTRPILRPIFPIPSRRLRLGPERKPGPHNRPPSLGLHSLTSDWRASALAIVPPSGVQSTALRSALAFAGRCDVSALRSTASMAVVLGFEVFLRPDSSSTYREARATE